MLCYARPSTYALHDVPSIAVLSLTEYKATKYMLFRVLGATHVGSKELDVDSNGEQSNS